MKDTEIFREIGIPTQTLQMWKKSDNYRKFLYSIIKSLPKEYVDSVRVQFELEESKKNLLISK